MEGKHIEIQLFVSKSVFFSTTTCIAEAFNILQDVIELYPNTPYTPADLMRNLVRMEEGLTTSFSCSKFSVIVRNAKARGQLDDVGVQQ